MPHFHIEHASIWSLRKTDAEGPYSIKAKRTIIKAQFLWSSPMIGTYEDDQSTKEAVRLHYQCDIQVYMGNLQVWHVRFVDQLIQYNLCV